MLSKNSFSYNVIKTHKNNNLIMGMLNKIFSQNVSEILETKKISIRNLATMSSVSRGTISAILSGKANPSLNIVESIAEALDKDPVDLIRGKSNINNDIPSGYKIIKALLTDYQAYLVRGWDKKAKQKIKGL
ncbi:helix-turn-helix domain-containing protein [Desulforhopalus vacuolatus]|uniref:helix-turn-helix domain-containing protein n=1 Tax=Desulforhopalus vacuolatus TaxID=40414 RepID=UPI0019656B2C|nr:helix-turn-helix domain-containing protein [Desulforhopalus vacuolatus]MBM9519140.1 helix-turn-helix domain-containing protein [Desulforhopalus vacuolatus]